MAGHTGFFYLTQMSPGALKTNVLSKQSLSGVKKFTFTLRFKWCIIETDTTRGGFTLEWMKIDQVAKRSGLTKRTIRFYEEIGLIPAPKRTEGGVRLYSEDDMEELEKVTSTKEVLGFSLQELQQFMEMSRQLELNKEGYLLSLDPKERKEKLEEIQHALNHQLEMIDEKISTFQHFKTRLNGMKEKADRAIQSIE
ncbi:hypothetical protein C2W63_03608 [Bacillus velezensis]|nr:hypothetical protein C2W63_03608 [Bacillus velezensis]RUS03797.1 hypothetical protein EFW58_03480 [Bacillus velezensis]